MSISTRRMQLWMLTSTIQTPKLLDIMPLMVNWHFLLASQMEAWALNTTLCASIPAFSLVDFMH